MKRAVAWLAAASVVGVMFIVPEQAVESAASTAQVDSPLLVVDVTAGDAVSLDMAVSSPVAPSPEPVPEPPVAPAPPAPEPEPEIVAAAYVAPVGVRETFLARLAELGAAPWVIRGFDCLGWAESGWRSVRGGPNSNGTFDNGPLQFNDVHWTRLNRLGLNPYDGRDAATYAMTLYWESGFGPWNSTRGKCGI